MMSLPNILTVACIATVGGVVAVGHTVLKDQFPQQSVKAFMHGDALSTPSVDGERKTTGNTRVFGVADDGTVLDYAARRYREIYAEALAAPEPEVTEKVNHNRSIRSSDFHMARRQALAASPQQLSNKQRTVFSRSRRAHYLASQGRAFTMTGTTGYNRGTRDERPIAPTGRQSIFQRSRFHKTNTSSRYSYSGHGRVRRVPRRIR